jgi:hypothetical protein
MKNFLAIYIGTEAALEKARWNELEEATREAREASGVRAWMEWGVKKLGRHRRPGKSTREDQMRVAGGSKRYQERHGGIRHRTSRISRSRCEAVRKPPALYHLPGRLGRDHGVSAASRSVTYRSAPLRTARKLCTAKGAH